MVIGLFNFLNRKIFIHVHIWKYDILRIQYLLYIILKIYNLLNNPQLVLNRFSRRSSCSVIFSIFFFLYLFILLYIKAVQITVFMQILFSGWLCSLFALNVEWNTYAAHVYKCIRSKLTLPFLRMPGINASRSKTVNWLKACIAFALYRKI